MAKIVLPTYGQSAAMPSQHAGYGFSDRRTSGSSSMISLPPSQSPVRAGQLYETSATVYGAIRVAGNAFKMLRPTLLKTKPGAAAVRPDVVRIHRHPIVDLMKWGNPAAVFPDVMFAAYANAMLYGRVYFSVEPTPDSVLADEPNAPKISIYALNPAWMTPVSDPVEGVRGYLYGPDGTAEGRSIFLARRAVIGFASYSPTNPLVGTSPAVVITPDAVGERAIRSQRAMYFERNASIAGVLSMPNKITDAERKRLKEDFRLAHSGAANSFRLLVLDQGQSYTNIGGAQADALFPTEVTEDTRNSIAMALGVPLALITGAPTRSNQDMRSAERLMYYYQVQPFAQTVQEHLSRWLNRYDPTLGVVFSTQGVDALRQHELDAMRTYVAAVNSGIKSPNEVRREMDMEVWDEEYAGDYGKTPAPLSNGKQGGSPSMPLTGSEGGRDQSATGEAQMVDETGEKSFELENMTADTMVRELLELYQD